MSYTGSAYEVINLGNNRTVGLREMLAVLEQALGVSARINATRSSRATSLRRGRGRQGANAPRLRPAYAVSVRSAAVRRMA